jgi:hypothetical protein
MSSLATLQSAMRHRVVTSIDETVPAGHFVATVKVNGVSTNVYLLEGTLDDPAAVIKGRIQDRGPGEAVRVYVGGSADGGSWVSRFESREQAFASML